MAEVINLARDKVRHCCRHATCREGCLCEEGTPSVAVRWASGEPLQLSAACTRPMDRTAWGPNRAQLGQQLLRQHACQQHHAC